MSSKGRNKPTLSRRDFLKSAVLGTAGIAITSLVSSCRLEQPTVVEEGTSLPETSDEPILTDPTPLDPVKVTWWTEAAEEGVQNAIVELLVEPFNASHPGVQLEMLFQAELIDKVKTAVAGGGGPCIIETGGPNINVEFYNAGYAVPLDSFAEQYGWREIMHPWAIANGTLGGHLISLQLSQETMMMVYNKGLLEEKGWELPTGPDELAVLADKCLADDIIPYASFPGWALYHSVIWNDYASALSVYKWLTGESSFTSDEFVKGADYFKMMIEEGWLGDKVWDMGYGDEWALLSSDKALMKMDGSWAFKTGGEAFQNFEWDVAPLPTLRSGITHTWQIGAGQSLSISADAKSPEGAAEVLDFVYSDPKRAGKLMAAHPGEWVVPIKMSEDDIPEDLDPRHRKVIAWMNQAGAENKIGYLTWSSWPPLTLGVSMDLADAQASGDISSEEFCEEIQTQFEAELKDGSMMEIPPTYGG